MNYTCENCKGVFEESWSDAEAREEYVENFPLSQEAETVRVCGDCYHLFMVRYKAMMQ